MRGATASRTPISQAPSARAPARPPDQGRVAPGRWAKKPATHTIQEQAASAGQAMTAAAVGQAGATSAARSPLMVAMTAAGSLSRLAGTDQAPTEG